MAGYKTNNPYLIWETVFVTRASICDGTALPLPPGGAGGVGVVGGGAGVGGAAVPPCRWMTSVRPVRLSRSMVS